MKLLKLPLITFVAFILNITGYSQVINVNASNPIVTQENSHYTFDPQGNTIKEWTTPSNCVVIGSKLTNNLTVKWKNVEASAYNSTLDVAYKDANSNTFHVTKSVGTFYLIFKVPSFVGGATKNIPCHVTSGLILALNPYINTNNNGVDKDLEITSKFEWTLPSGWQTTSGQIGTFVSGSSLSVIPPASISSESIKVRAKADWQYSSFATLQITRNLDAFTISGSTSVYYNSTYRYSAPSNPGVYYTWQLPAGWSGQSTGSYIEVTAGCSTGIMSCTMTGCNQSKTSTITISSNTINPATLISGLSSVCVSGTAFTVNNLPARVNHNLESKL